MMRPRNGALLILFQVIALSGVFSGSVAASTVGYKPGEVIVKYKNGIERTRSDMYALYDKVGVENVSHYTGIMGSFEHLVLGEKANVQEAIAKLSRSYAVEYAQPNYILHIFPVKTSDVTTESLRMFKGVPCIIPGIFPPGCDEGDETGDPGDSEPGDTVEVKRPILKDAPSEITPAVKDPSLTKTYGLKKVGATRIWNTYSGTKDFIVADIDTGIDYNHEDLAFNVWRNPSPSAKNDIVGFDFIHDDGLPFDDNDHGTHTAGTIGAVGGNGVGISGVAQRVSIMSLKFLSKEGSGTTADAIRAIDYAVSHGAKVLSNSWGGKSDTDNQALRDAIERAKDADVLFIAAAGNEGKNNDDPDPDYPAAFDNDNLISVAATDERDELAFFSNYGKKSTHLSAPGVNIYSTTPGNRYGKKSGTSMACPHVAGAAALLWARHPDWNYKKVKEVLLSTVDPIEALAEKTVTGGRLNIEKAISENE